MNEAEKQVLLTGLRALMSNKPVFDGLSQQVEGYDWVGRVQALVGMKSREMATGMDTDIRFLQAYSTFGGAWGRIVTLAARAMAELEVELAAAPQSAAKVFGPGAVYDVHAALRAILRQAQSNVLIVDPYMDADIFDGSISALNSGVTCELLTSRNARGVEIAAKKYLAQYPGTVSLRSSNEIHDRIILVDGKTCWVLGQSIKHAALSKPTYLAPLDDEMSKLKSTLYGDIWNRASVVIQS